MLVLICGTGCGANDRSVNYREATKVASLFIYNLHLQIPIKIIAEGNIIIIFNFAIILSLFLIFSLL